MNLDLANPVPGGEGKGGKLERARKEKERRRKGTAVRTGKWTRPPPFPSAPLRIRGQPIADLGRLGVLGIDLQHTLVMIAREARLLELLRAEIRQREVRPCI